MIAEAIRKVMERKNLSREEAFLAMQEIMSGACSDAQIAAFLTALRMKGESVEELIGFATLMREKVIRVPSSRAVLVDTCGTGGDGARTFNISTTAAFVVAGAGIPVAKHGNRSVSSLCGSANVMEALGVDLTLPPEAVGRCLDEVGIGFLYAPLLHPAMRHAMPVRKELQVRTVFNLLGPLTNPAGANAHLVGVYDEHLTEVLASVLKALGAVRAFVVHGQDGLDEITNTSETKISEVRNGKVSTYSIKPEDFGISRATLPALKGGDARENAEIIEKILGGEKSPRRDVVLLNAAAGIVAGQGADELFEGFELARRSIDSGAALEKLRELQSFYAAYARE